MGSDSGSGGDGGSRVVVVVMIIVVDGVNSCGVRGHGSDTFCCHMQGHQQWKFQLERSADINEDRQQFKELTATVCLIQKIFKDQGYSVSETSRLLHTFISTARLSVNCTTCFAIHIQLLLILW